MADDIDDLIEAAGADDDVGVATGNEGGFTKRDVYGRFAPTDTYEADNAAARAEEAAAAGDPVVTPPAAADKPATFREMQEFLQETQARQAAERRAEQLQHQLDQNAPKPKSLLDDPASLFEDPAAYIREAMAPVNKQVQDLRMQNAELIAWQTHGMETVKAAKSWIAETKNEDLASRLMDAPNPFDALVRAHKQSAALTAIPDGDLGKYRASLLQDPAFRTEALAAWNAGQTPAPGQTRGNVTRLPSAARAGTAAQAAIPDDLSDEQLYESFTARPQRSR